MNDQEPLKSAFELAMERLRSADREAGIEEDAPLTKAQKAEIAEVRRDARAKLAELEVLHTDRRREAGEDAEQRRQVEERYQIDRRRIESALDSAVARVRRRS
jgi:hypothetical protein